MRFLIVGVGAIGGAFLSFLTRAGHEAVGLVKRGRELTSIEVEGIWGEFKVDVHTTDNISSIEFTPDVVIVAVKSYDTESALRNIRGVVRENTLLMIAQNGYGNYEKAVESFGSDRVILSRIIFGSEVLSPGKIKITVSADDVVIGDPSGEIEEDSLTYLAQLFSEAGIPTRHEKEVYKYLWDKIIYNCALNPLGALLETNYGTLAENEHTRSLMDRIIDEVFEVTRKAGIETFWDSPDNYKESFYCKLIPPTKEHYPSMLRDIKKGRTEIDALNGAIWRLGSKVGVSTPVNEHITMLIKAKELINREA